MQFLRQHCQSIHNKTEQTIQQLTKMMASKAHRLQQIKNAYNS